MRLSFRLLSFISLTYCFVSCSKSRETNTVPKSFSFKITDSVLVNYLGEMMLMDYDPKSDTYLLATNTNYEYMEVNGAGEILHHNTFNSDGVNAVTNTLGLGYFNGDVTVFDPPTGYHRFQDSSKVGEITIPYPSQIFMMYPKLGVFESKTKIYYPKPWPESLKIAMEDGDFYKALYRLPIIESQDKETGDTLGVVRLPEDSKLLDGQVHGFPIPVYTKTDNLLLLSMWLEPRFYVYKQAGDNFEYERTVAVNIPDWIPYDPVPADKVEQVFEGFDKKSPGSLTNLFKVGENFVIVYNKGISEEKMATLNRQNPNFGLERKKLDPHYAAVFDKDFNQIATDVPFPATSNYPNVVNAKGELVVSKHAGLSETEDDGIVLYKLRLARK